MYISRYLDAFLLAASLRSKQNQRVRPSRPL